MGTQQQFRGEEDRERIVAAFRTVGESIGRMVADVLTRGMAETVPAAPIGAATLGRVEAATHIGVSPTTIDRLRRLGHIQPTLIEDTWRYPRQELDRFIREGSPAKRKKR
jgi:hypothetical protein